MPFFLLFLFTAFFAPASALLASMDASEQGIVGSASFSADNDMFSSFGNFSMPEDVDQTPQEDFPFENTSKNQYNLIIISGITLIVILSLLFFFKRKKSTKKRS